MRQNEYFINPSGFADPNDKFVCYSHRTKKVTVHCADGSTHPSVHSYDNIKTIMSMGDYWKKIDYKTAYSLLKPLDKTEILHYYIPTTKHPRNTVELISCNKITKKTTVYYKDGHVEELDNYARCGKLRLVTKQEALNVLNKKVKKVGWKDIKFDNDIKTEDEKQYEKSILNDEKHAKLYYVSATEPWATTAYLVCNLHDSNVFSVKYDGSVEWFKNLYPGTCISEKGRGNWKEITKDEALARVIINKE